MKRTTFTGLIIVFLMLLQIVAVSALTASEAKSNWLEARDITKEKQAIHQDAKLDFAADNSDENKEAVVDTGKVLLHAVLDEVEAWLAWKETEANNPKVPDHIREMIEDDVAANLEVIEELRGDIDGVDNQLQLGLVSLKMVGKYVELLVDVARDSGMMWVHLGNTHAEKLEEFETKLRTTAEKTDNDAAIAKLDTALSELETARQNIDNAEGAYEQVRVPGTPFIKFGEGNSYLRAGQANMLAAHRNLNQAYAELVR